MGGIQVLRLAYDRSVRVGHAIRFPRSYAARVLVYPRTRQVSSIAMH